MQTIFILDYDADIAFVLSTLLQTHGFNAKSFTRLEPFLFQVKTQQPDLIILDCLFGKITTTAKICHTIQHLFGYKGKILLTSTSNISLEDFRSCNANGFVPKPFEVQKIFKVLNNHSGHSLANSIAE